MANQNDGSNRRQKPDRQDAFYFEDDLDAVTAGLPTGDEPEEEEAEPLPEPEDAPLTAGINSTGIRMVGLNANRASADEDGIVRGKKPARPSMDFYMEDELEPERAPQKAQQETDADLDSSDSQIDRGYGKQKNRVDDAEKAKGKQKQKKSHPILRTILIWTVSVILLGIIGIMALARTMYQDSSLLTIPENTVSSLVTPVQTWFSGIVQSISDYFYMVRLRSNWETEYNRVVSENMEYAQLVARNAELEKQISQFTNMQEEIATNVNMNPLAAQVIAREQGTYFSVFTVNKGSRDGVEEYMAVTISGALVGYTENVYESSCTVRTIIDSDASIAALIQSSRDQGIVSGTLGVDGTALCRMYYLPDDSLPRPGDQVVTSGVGFSFPKGIPIGTVRESTRGIDGNKQYVVIEPQADFEHLEYVIILRYKPEAEAIEGREANSVLTEYVPLVTARPYPTLKIGSTTMFGATATPTEVPSVTPSPTPSPTPTASPTPSPEPTPRGTVYEYNSTLLSPTATPSPSPTPSPTPIRTINPGDLDWEE